MASKHKRFALEVALEDGAYVQYFLIYRKPFFGHEFELVKRTQQSVSDTVEIARDTYTHWRAVILQAGFEGHEDGDLISVLG